MQAGLPEEHHQVTTTLQKTFFVIKHRHYPIPLAFPSHFSVVFLQSWRCAQFIQDICHKAEAGQREHDEVDAYQRC